MKSKLHSMKSLKSSQQAKPLKTASFQALGLTKVSDFNLWLKGKHFNLMCCCNTSLQVQAALELLAKPTTWVNFLAPFVTSQNPLQCPSSPVGPRRTCNLPRNTSALREWSNKKLQRPLSKMHWGGISKQYFSDASWKLLKFSLKILLL